jgi:hypothetical protein
MKLMKKEKRKKEIRLRKNFYLTLLITVFLWLCLIALIFLTEPNDRGVIPLFFLLTLVSLTFTFSIIFVNTRKGIVLSLVITLFLFLRYLGIGNILNFLLLAGVGIATELYFSKK